jgi:glycosyltransferase involved in cell wall biosynthesis
MDGEKILIVSHAHPKFSKGGGEIAAYNMYRELLRQGFDAYFLAAHFSDKAHHGYTPFSIVNDREILVYATPMDYYINSAYDMRHTWKHFRELLEMLEPDIIHFHHYMHLGLEKIRECHNYRMARPDRKIGIFLTLHEYIAICAHNGQMVKKGSGELCYRADYVDCATCFPERSANDFFLREKYIKSFFELVDHFISPSNFLIDRYVNWGIPAEKMTMLENGQVYDTKSVASKRKLEKGEKRSIFGYFGQLNPFKGIDILMDAVGRLDEETLKDFRLHIHGTGMSMWPQEFQDKIKESFEKYSDNVTFFGKYESHELPALMAEVDWVIIPSIWWENSPLVIQEAYKFGKPLIGSDIGGMAEKIVDGVTGLHFRARNAESLARTIERALRERDLYESLTENIEKPISIEESVDRHLEIYGIDRRV